MIAWLDVILSVLVLLALPGIYIFIIRPRLKVSPAMADIYGRFETAEASTWAWIKNAFWRFRTFVVGAVGLVVGVLPDLLEQLHLVDWGDVLPDEWKGWSGMVTIAVMIALRAVATTPGNQPPT